MKKLLKLLGLLILILAAVLLFNTFTLSSDQPAYDAVAPVSVPDQAIDHFRTAVTFKTVSYTDRSRIDTAEFRKFQAFVRETYPLVDSLLDRKIFNHTLFYTWPGTDPKKPGVVLMGHYDVVPVDSSTMDKWEAGPFSGDLIDNKIYGRGTLDDKINVIALLETAEMLLSEGFKPGQNIYLSFGHDEEIGGDQGAKQAAEYLRSLNLPVAFALDEGGYIAPKELAHTRNQVAFINTAEKGYVSYKLKINTPGGHSSEPPKDNTIGSLAAAITRLENNPFPYHMAPLVKTQIEKVAPALDNFGFRMAAANKWLFGKFILEGMNAHTTLVPTIISGGVKDNVIPTEASVVVNSRIMPGETPEDVLNHIRKIVKDDRISVEVYMQAGLPTPVSDAGSDSYKLLEKTILQLMPETTIAPGLLGGGTDSKHYIGIAENVYRFYPMRIETDCMSCFHGNNEHISVDNFKGVVQFCYQLIRNLNE